MKYKDIPRKKFTEKQLKLLEKAHWLAKRAKYAYLEEYDELRESYQRIESKIEKFLSI